MEVIFFSSDMGTNTNSDRSPNRLPSFTPAMPAPTVPNTAMAPAVPSELRNTPTPPSVPATAVPAAPRPTAAPAPATAEPIAPRPTETAGAARPPVSPSSRPPPMTPPATFQYLLELSTEFSSDFRILYSAPPISRSQLMQLMRETSKPFSLTRNMSTRQRASSSPLSSSAATRSRISSRRCFPLGNRCVTILRYSIRSPRCTQLRYTPTRGSYTCCCSWSTSCERDWRIERCLRISVLRKRAMDLALSAVIHSCDGKRLECSCCCSDVWDASACGCADVAVLALVRAPPLPPGFFCSSDLRGNGGEALGTTAATTLAGVEEGFAAADLAFPPAATGDPALSVGNCGSLPETRGPSGFKRGVPLPSPRGAPRRGVPASAVWRSR
mmetsp:Transcript_16266/g.40146  ORF Transcript_16266/g.40146 Transcript_16266/m.40146 type:complete len:384 (-) Transcript_16266:1419-2570(-)